jgi:drug/metabolite transporter (DMT)-like permease
LSTKHEEILMKSASRVAISPLLVLFLGIFAVSTASLFIRLAQHEAPSLTVAAYRLTLASIVLGPVVWGRKSELLQLTGQQRGMLLLSGAFLAVHFATWITSLAYTSVASSVVLVTTTPLWVALFSPLILKEHLDRQAWGGVAVALAGGILVGLSEACTFNSGKLSCQDLTSLYQGRAFWGNLLALVGAWMAAGYLLVGRKVRPSLSLPAYIGSVYPIAAILLDLMALFGHQAMFGFSPLTYIWFLALALFPQLLGHTSYNYALGYLPAAYVSIAVLAEPIGTTLLAIAVLKENPTTLEVIGGLIILAGIGLASWKKDT